MNKYMLDIWVIVLISLYNVIQNVGEVNLKIVPITPLYIKFLGKVPKR